jgi:hypothetical protein
MSIARKIMEEIERLPAKDRRKILRQLERSLASDSRKKDKREGRRRSTAGPYTALLEIAGTAHGESGDVSTDKYHHLASVYAATRGSK